MKDLIMKNKLIGVILLGLALVGATNYSRLVAGNYGINNTAKPQLVINPMAEYNTNNITLTNAVITMQKLADWQDVAAKGVFKVVNNLSVGAVRTAFQVIPPKGEFLSGMCQIELLYSSARTLQLTTNNSMLTMVLPPTPTNTLMMAAPQLPCSNLTTVIVSDETGGTGTEYYIGKNLYKKADGPFIAQPENTARAFVDASGNISNKSGPDIFNAGPFAPSDTSLYAIGLKGLTQTPSCNVEYYSRATFETAASFFAQKEGTQSNTVLTVRTFYNNPAGANRLKAAGAFTITCTLNGSDNIKNVVPVSNLRQPTVTRLTSGSGTYTVPQGVSRIEIKMVGGGGGGSGSGTGTGGGNGGTGGNTTFGSSFLVANGGVGGSSNSFGGAGGSSSIASPAYGSNGNGGAGQTQANSVTTFNVGGGNGGVNIFGGAGYGGYASNPALAGVANSGAGGGGAGGGNNIQSGSGGGAGGWVDVIVPRATGSYPYTVGAGGAGGTAGTSGTAGGGGGYGVIIITEFYFADVAVYVDTVKVRAEKSTAQLLTTTLETIINMTELNDSHGFFNPTTGVFSPTHGEWWCSVKGSLTVGSPASSTNHVLTIYKGSTQMNVNTVNTFTDSWRNPIVTADFKVSALEAVTFRSSVGVGTRNTETNTSWNNFSITCTPY